MLNLVSKPSSTFLFVHKIYYVSILLPEKNPVKCPPVDNFFISLSFQFQMFEEPVHPRRIWNL